MQHKYNRPESPTVTLTWHACTETPPQPLFCYDSAWLWQCCHFYTSTSLSSFSPHHQWFTPSHGAVPVSGQRAGLSDWPLWPSAGRGRKQRRTLGHCRSGSVTATVGAEPGQPGEDDRPAWSGSHLCHCRTGWQLGIVYWQVEYSTRAVAFSTYLCHYRTGWQLGIVCWQAEYIQYLCCCFLSLPVSLQDWMATGHCLLTGRVHTVPVLWFGTKAVCFCKPSHAVSPCSFSII